MIFSRKDIMYMTATVYGEARGEPYLGKVAVAHVIVNRAKRPGWWSRQVDDVKDDTPAAVCVDKYQFSCWNESDPNSSVVRKIAIERLDPYENKSIRSCLYAVLAAIEGEQDPTDNATHYHTKNILPHWAEDLDPSFAIGNHLFYNNVK